MRRMLLWVVQTCSRASVNKTRMRCELLWIKQNCRVPSTHKLHPVQGPRASTSKRLTCVS